MPAQRVTFVLLLMAKKRLVPGAPRETEANHANHLIPTSSNIFQPLSHFTMAKARILVEPLPFCREIPSHTGGYGLAPIGGSTGSTPMVKRTICKFWEQVRRRAG